MPPRSKRPSEGDQRDLAVVVSDADIARVKKLAKRARVELSTFAKVSEAPPYYRVVALGESWTPETDDRIEYIARATINDDDFVELLVSLANDRAAPAPALTKPHSAAEARRTQVALAGARQLAHTTTLAEAEAISTETINELLDTDRAYCWFFDPDKGTLWQEKRRRTARDERRAIAGIVGWAARTGRAVSTPRASGDPRWLGPIDDPDGDPNSQLLVQPVIRADHRVGAVLVAVRRARRPGFVDLDNALMARFAALAAPMLEQLSVRIATLQIVGDDPTLEPPQAPIDPKTARWWQVAYAMIGALIALMIVFGVKC